MPVSGDGQESVVEDLGLNPYRQSKRRLFWSRKSITLHLSRTLEISDKREIGQ